MSVNIPPEESPSNNPTRPFIGWMGEACSDMIVKGLDDDDLTDRCVRYWEENLRYAVALQNGPWAGMLESAYLNVAVAHNLRYGASREAGRDDRSDLDMALSYARAAVRVGGEAPRPRTRAALANFLYLAAERGDNTWTDAVAQQNIVLEDAFAIDDSADRIDALTEVFDLLIPPDDGQSLQLFLAAAQAVAVSPTTPLYGVLAAVRHVIDNSGCLTTQPQEVAERVLTVVEATLDRAAAALTVAIDGRTALALLQGASSSGAVAAAALNRNEQSLQVLERGATMRVDLMSGSDSAVILGPPQRSGRHVTVAIRNFRPDLDYCVSTSSGAAHIDQRGIVHIVNASLEKPIEIVVEVEGFLDQLSSSGVLAPSQLHVLAADLGDPLIYLAVTEHTGLALVVGPRGKLESVWLPCLTEDRVREWLTQLEESARQAPGRGGQTTYTKAGRDALVRGPRGEAAPARAVVDLVLHEAAEALRPLERIFHQAKDAIHLIPIGMASGVPWPAAISVLGSGHRAAVTVNPSATLLALDLTRPARKGEPVAITAPEPCSDLVGQPLPFLTYANEEGRYLQRRYGADHATRADARKDRYLTAVGSSPVFLHLAVHGCVEPDEMDSAQLIWVAEPSEGPQVTHLDDLSSHPVSCGLVFLAACWGGTPNRLLPDESISFPTAFLRAGALTVISPLWPIEDATAKAVAVKFYDNWVSQGMPAAQALQRACSQVKSSRRHQNATWAAFQMSGKNLRYRDDV